MNTESTPAVALRDAIGLLGGQSALSRLIGITQQSISRWVLEGKSLPAEHVLKVEAATGISRHVLRPDIYPLESVPPPGNVLSPGGASPGHATRPGEAPDPDRQSSGSRPGETRAACPSSAARAPCANEEAPCASQDAPCAPEGTAP